MPRLNPLSIPVEPADTIAGALLLHMPPEGVPVSKVVDPRQAILLPDIAATGLIVTGLYAAQLPIV